MENNRLDQLFQSAREQQPQVSFEETKKNFLQSLRQMDSKKGGNKGNSILFNLKNKIIMLVSSIAIVTGVLFFFHEPTPTELKQNSFQNTQEITKPNTELNQGKIQPIESKKDFNITIEKSVAKTELNTEKKNKSNQNKPLGLKIDSNEILNTTTEKFVAQVDTSYVFPVLTPEEISENEKQKRNMLKQLMKFEKDLYSLVPMGTYTKESPQVSIQSFYIQKYETTNLEYRTFLFDLLIQKRFDEFLKAKPDQTMWTKLHFSFAQPMQDNYFSHEAYNSYPVVNISREGAEMYCFWMTQELYKSGYLKQNQIINDVRIPSNEEWKYAASSDNKNFPFPWGGPNAQNVKGCYLANFKPGVDTAAYCFGKYYDKPNVTESNGLGKYVKTLDDVFVNNKNNNAYIADGGMFTVKTTSYSPNDLGLFNMSGNVAEMVYYNNNKSEPGTRGGGWMSEIQELPINGEDQYKGVVDGHPNIGFRVIISYTPIDKKKEAFMPPNGSKIAEDLYMDETEITNFNWMEYIFWQKKTFGENSEEYKKSLPDTLVWTTKLGFNEPYVNYYFRHAAYSEYPLVGVSYKQAVAFCSWRTDRVKELYEIAKKENPNQYYPTDFKYRLLSKDEWELVATVGFDKNNFFVTDGKYKGLNKYNFKRDTANSMGLAGRLNGSADVTAPVRSYWPNNNGIYNLIGNVAEMTNQKGIAKGGSWLNSKEEISIEKDFEYTEPTSWLGFRCVFEIIQD